MTKQPDFCIFCSDRPLTHEHVYSRWTHRYLPRSMANYRSLQATSHRGRSDYKIFKRAGDIIDWKVKCVCGPRCNNGWMRKKIDEPAMPVMKPLIEGTPARITPDQQRIIASWATLKAMVAEYDVNSHVVSHYMQRKYLMNHHRPPQKGWSVWIGHHVRTPAGKFHWGSFPALILPNSVAAKRKSQRANHYNSGASSMLIGQLFIQIMRSPHRPLISKWRFWPPDGGALYRIWPPTDTSIVWPGKSLTARDVDYAIGALKAFLESSAA